MTANESLHAPVEAAGMVERGDADVVSLGRSALTQADWSHRLRDGNDFDEFDRGLLSPIADWANADWLRDTRLA